jgi:hypothetical protein
MAIHAQLKTLANGTHTIDVPPGATLHQITFVVRDGAAARAVPSGGQVIVTGKQPGNTTYEVITNGTVDLTAAANWSLFLNPGIYTTLQFVLSSIEAAHTLDIFVASARFE